MPNTSSAPKDLCRPPLQIYSSVRYIPAVLAKLPALLAEAVVMSAPPAPSRIAFLFAKKPAALVQHALAIWRDSVASSGTPATTNLLSAYRMTLEVLSQLSLKNLSRQPLRLP